MGTYIGNDSNNVKVAEQEWVFWPFSKEWKSWTMVGKGGHDSLTGGEKDDYIYGDFKLGSYAATGISGNDTLRGRGGHDRLYGEAGVDVLYGDSGYDYLFGGSDRDYLYGGTDGDSLYGESGDDCLYGESGYDYLNGGTGNDYLYGGSQTDTLVGDSGNDYLNGFGSTLYEKDSLYGGADADRFVLGDYYGVHYTGDGFNGYAIINDFTYGWDKIQVKGSLNNYQLKTDMNLVGSSASDTAIFYGNELIGVVRDNTSIQLTSAYFTSV